MRFNFDFSFLSRLGKRLGFDQARPPGESYYIYILMLLIAFWIADCICLSVRAYMLPSGGGRGAYRTSFVAKKSTQQAVYPVIRDKNIFNSDHLIAETKSSEENPGASKLSGKPVKTSLPLELVGTIVHSNPERSVATIQVRGKSEIQPYKKGDKIENLAEVTNVERQKVFFRNLKEDRLEYVEMKEDKQFKLGLANPSAGPVTESGGDATNFSFTRDEINKQLENLSQILQEAQAVEVKRGDKIIGFKLVAIKAGSIYEKLGLKRGDMIKGVNGEAVDSAAKAMELYRTLKNEPNISVEVGRGSSTTTLNYNITE